MMTFAQELHRRVALGAYIDITTATHPKYLLLSLSLDGVRLVECSTHAEAATVISDRKLSLSTINAALVRMDNYGG